MYNIPYPTNVFGFYFDDETGHTDVLATGASFTKTLGAATMVRTDSYIGTCNGV